MLLFLVFFSLAVCARQEGFPGCPPRWDLGPTSPDPTQAREVEKEPYISNHCSGDSSSRSVAFRVETPNLIDTYPNWNGANSLSSVGRPSNDASIMWGQSFVAPVGGGGLLRRNLLTAQFSLATTTSTPIQFNLYLFAFDSTTAIASGSPLWTSSVVTVPVTLPTPTFIDALFTITQTGGANNAPPLNAGSSYILAFLATLASGNGGIARTSGAYANGGLFIKNSGLLNDTASWFLLNSNNDAAFNISFDNVQDCIGLWIPDPAFNVSANLGNPQNCVESSCSNSTAPVAGLLYEVFHITTNSTPGGSACIASEGQTRATLPCVQQNPCQNCVQTVTVSPCTALSHNPCSAVVSTSFSLVQAAVASFAGPVPAACQSNSTSGCPCTDCVETNSDSACAQTICGNAAGTFVRTWTTSGVVGPGTPCAHTNGQTTTLQCVVSNPTPCIGPTE